MNKATKIFAVITLMAAFSTSAVASATGPYLGAAYSIKGYKDGSKTLELRGEKTDVEVEFARMRYQLIKEGQLRGTYFFTDGADALAKLYVSPKAHEYLKILEFEGTSIEVQKKAKELEAYGYEVTDIRWNKVIAFKKVM